MLNDGLPVFGSKVMATRYSEMIIMYHCFVSASVNSSFIERLLLFRPFDEK